MTIEERLQKAIDKYAETRGGMAAGFNERLLADALSEIKQWKHQCTELRTELTRTAPLSATAPLRCALTPQQLADICTFSFGMSCDAPEDAADIVVGYLPEHESGPGWYVWCGEYPEEGSVAIHRKNVKPDETAKDRISTKERK